MPRDSAYLTSQLEQVTEESFRDRLVSRGQAQSMVRRDGELAQGSPGFGAYLDQDLLDYGYSLLNTALQLIESDMRGIAGYKAEVTGGSTPARKAFLQASYALEAATRNASPAGVDIDFHRLIAGAASHMAGYAARAYSLVEASRTGGELSPMELTLADLLMRQLGSIEQRAVWMRNAPEATDEALTEALLEYATEGEEAVGPAGSTGGFADTGDRATESMNLRNLGPLAVLLTEHYLSSVSTALFALSFESDMLLATALSDLKLGEDASSDIAAPGPWWVFRLTRHIVSDLDQTSIPRNLPTDPPGAGDASSPPSRSSDRPEVTTEVGTSGGTASRWKRLRRTYIEALMARDRAEIDLWPSQLRVVKRIFASSDDLVVALPTSAGKTRIAELCILRCLAQGRRTVYVTPLRALSAQTERIMEDTFAPLGGKVSSLYGSMGYDDLDGDALRASDIVIATPEKLDFALRSEPTVLDDVGLIILDEGHMIGPGEREILYEAQIQRLLRRSDADTRRIVCLSAVFPDDDQLEDFVGWITADSADGPHLEDWRPTLQRFGVVEWQTGGFATMTVTVGDEQPSIPKYLEAKAPKGRRKLEFPKDQNEMTLATAWRLVGEGHTVLVFCPLKVSVGALASLVVKLHRQGLVASVLPEGTDISDAVAIGAEWFGADHDIVECLRLGVAIHHGGLPAPFRREIEALLDRRSLKMTVASPTLAQGLNLSASVVLFSSLHRHGHLLAGSEFANVIGRAGRAFVDTEGLVLYPLFEPTTSKRRNWLELTDGSRSRKLQSGLIAVGEMLLNRMRAAFGPTHLSSFLGYLTGGWAWSFPTVFGEDAKDQDRARTKWVESLSKLDTAILSVLGDDTSDPAQVIQLLADAMRGSLWERQLRRLDSMDTLLLRSIVEQRARFVWDNSSPEQRRGWYLAGLGADAGAVLSGAAASIVSLSVDAEIAIASGDLTGAAETIIELAAQVFSMPKFAASTDNWRPLLAHWLSGRPLSEVDAKQSEVAKFIERDAIYLLVWGMEAARMYELAQGNPLVEQVRGLATTAIETGTLSVPAALMIRSGFDHRTAANSAVADTGADFVDSVGMRAWLASIEPTLAEDPRWPSESSRRAWVEFTRRVQTRGSRRWQKRSLEANTVEWVDLVPDEGALLRVTGDRQGKATIWTPGWHKLGTLDFDLNEHGEGTIHAVAGPDGNVTLRYRGPATRMVDPTAVDR